jgi:predicted Rossmann-fold nucleotide-binding protein
MYSSNGQEAWRVLGIMAEFATATERMRGIRPAVSMFGSARIGEGHAYYEVSRTIARKLSDAGFSVISGGGPGLMEAANKVRTQAARRRSASTSRCPTKRATAASRTSRSTSCTSSRAR